MTTSCDVCGKYLDGVARGDALRERDMPRIIAVLSWDHDHLLGAMCAPCLKQAEDSA